MRHARLHFLGLLIPAAFTSNLLHGQVFDRVGLRIGSSVAVASVGEQLQLQGTFSRFELLTLDPAPLVALGSSTSIDLEIGTGGERSWHLVLDKHDLLAPDYVCRVATDQGIVELPRPEVTTWSGHVAGAPDSRARFSIRDGMLIGNVNVDGEDHFMEPLAHLLGGTPDGRHVIYRLQDVITDPELQCGVAAASDLADPGAVMLRNGEQCRTAFIAIAADGSMVEWLGSVAAVQDRIIDLLNWVDGKYQEPTIGIAYQLLTVFISSSTANDPWSNTQNASDLLGDLRAWGNGGGFGNVPFSTATLWTRRDIQGNGGSGTIGLAYVGTICGNSRYNICEHYSSNLAGPMILQSHELGHNWSASHASSGQWIMGPTINVSNTNWDPATISSIVAHKNSRACLGSSCEAAPEAAWRVGSSLSCNGTVSFHDESTNAPVSWNWEFGDGNTSNQQSPVHTYANEGTYDVQLTVSNASGSSSMTRSNAVTVTLLEPPVTTGDQLCHPGGVASLSATGGGTLRWYAQAQGGEALHTGPSLTTDVTATTTWYVESATPGPPMQVGPFNNSIGGGGYFSNNANRGTYFDVYQPMVLRSVKVYAEAAGMRTVQLLNAQGNAVQSRNVQIAAGESRIDLDMVIQPGQQYLLKLGDGVLGLYRNTGGANYPYTVPGLVSITGGNGSENAVHYYYFFYDWTVEAVGCASARTEVTAVVEVCSAMEQAGAGLVWTLFPNPSTGIFTLAWDALHTEPPGRIVVHDALGQRVFEARVQGVGTTTFHLDGASGIYFLQVIDRAGKPLMERRLVLER